MSEATLITPREPGEERCPVYGHETMPRVGCPSCAADAKAGEPGADAVPPVPPLHYAVDVVATRTLCGRKIRPGMRVTAKGRPLIVDPSQFCAACVAEAEAPPPDPQVECVPVPAGAGGEA